MKNLLTATNISKDYLSDGIATSALRGVSFEVGAGDYVAVVGPSGSGKSTLLSIIGGLSRPTGGTLTVDGIDVYSLPSERLTDFRREYVGFVFQQFQLITYLSALENVMLPLVAAGCKSSLQRERAMEVLDRVGLGNKADRLPSQLSGGEQERVAIARAIVNKPPLVLADEPTGALDSETSEKIMDLFGELNAEGQTVLVITHNPQVAQKTRRIVEIVDGRIVAA